MAQLRYTHNGSDSHDMLGALLAFVQHYMCHAQACAHHAQHLHNAAHLPGVLGYGFVVPCLHHELQLPHHGVAQRANDCGGARSLCRRRHAGAARQEARTDKVSDPSMSLNGVTLLGCHLRQVILLVHCPGLRTIHFRTSAARAASCGQQAARTQRNPRIRQHRAVNWMAPCTTRRDGRSGKFEFSCKWSAASARKLVHCTMPSGYAQLFQGQTRSSRLPGSTRALCQLS